MGKTKKELPRKRDSLTKNRNILKVLPQQRSVQPPAANIRVVVRVRPQNAREQGENARMVVRVEDDEMLVFDPKEDAQSFFFHGVQQKGRDLLKKSHKDMKFMFDRVFSTDSGTEEIFKNTTFTLIESLMDGYNCSVFAYGATGAGKTFTMTGTEENPGITFLTMTELFRRREELNADRDFEVGITYLEVYNELVKDLLNPGPPLNLREDAKYGVTVAGIKVYKIKAAEELFCLLEQGNKNRTQHPTDANAESSRSHAVFQVYLQMTIKKTKEIRMAKLSMIDLAGSERGSATGYVGARFTEGANINRSLLALGNCINSLADGLKHVPYRDSKLTRLLKDSLGGNCQTVMIANISPSSLSYEDTYNTLKYATRAKKIKSHITRNVKNVDLRVADYVKMLEESRKEVALLKAQLAAEMNKPPSENTASSEMLEKSRKEVTLLKVNNTELVEEVVRLKKIIEDIRRIGGGQVIVSDDTVLKEVDSLVLEKKELLERELELEKSQSGTAIRRRLKQEIDNRISGIMTDTPEKEQVHNKISMTVDRFKKQENAVKEDLDIVQLAKKEVDERLEKYMTDYPNLRDWITSQKCILINLEHQNQIDLLHRNIGILRDDQLSKDVLLEEMAILLKKVYMQLKGHNLLPDSIKEQYDNIVQSFQGKKNIKWAELPDSGISSTTSITSADGVVNHSDSIKTTPNKKDELNGTFTKNVSSPMPGKKKIHGKQPPNKNVSKVAGIKPFVAKKFSPNKENNPFRKPLDTIRSIAASRTIKAHPNFKTKSPKKHAERPRFRS